MRVVELLYAGSSLDHAREQSGSNTRSMRAHWMPTVCRWLADHHYNCESHFASPYNLPFGGYLPWGCLKTPRQQDLLVYHDGGKCDVRRF